MRNRRRRFAPSGRSQIGLVSIFVRGLILAVVLDALGLTYFVATLPKPDTQPSIAADAIVALTGQGGRLAPAVHLLEEGKGMRLLISGVNRLTSKSELGALLHAGEKFECCADLGFAAEDTRGNAREAAEWVRAHAYTSVIVVTADYHMPRSLIEFAAQMPGVRFVPFPVMSEAPRHMSWSSMRLLQSEYVKYLASLVRVSVLRQGEA